MLSDHDDKRGKGCPSNPWNSEELDKAGDIVALANDLFLNFELAVDVVQVSRGLEGVIAQFQEGSVRLRVFVLLCI